jgi:DMSO reductase family type II enzyme heme b subunit
MKRIAALLPFMFLLPPTWAAPAMERLLPAGFMATSPPLDPADPTWVQAPTTRVALYPQATAPGGPGGVVLAMEARVLQGGGRLALRLAWPDATADIAAAATHRFADAAAVQFAVPGATLPYIGMGEPERPVQVWLWRAGRPVERLSARGFGSLAKQDGVAPEAQARRTATGWEVVLRGEMDSATAAAFAVWDGAEDGRAGRKRLSAWRALGPLEGALLEEARATGNPARGERLYAEHGCTACHAAGAGLAPDLTHAGGIHWPGYLRRAIGEPAGFLVPGYGAIMPALPLRPEELEDLVTYLMTLN